MLFTCLLEYFHTATDSSSAPRSPFPGYSWFFNQHAVCYDEDVFRSVLGIAAKHEGEANPGASITKEMMAANILTINIRADSGEPGAWRDYQQSFAEVGAIYSTLLTGDSKVIITPVGRALLDGELTYDQFLTVQALGYQYPNGSKRVMQANVRSALQGTSLASFPTLIDVQLRSGVKLKPFLLCLQVLRQLATMGGTPYLTRDEIQRFLAYQRNNDKPDVVAKLVLGFRKSGGGPPPVGRSRNFSDIITFLGRTSLFKEVKLSSPSLGLRDSSEDAAKSADRMIAAELRPAAWFSFQDGSVEESKKWFAHYGAFERADPLLDPVSVSKQVAQDNILDEVDSAPETLGPPPGLIEHTSRKDQRSPAATPVAATSPEETAMLREKARKGHRELVDLMAGKVRAAGGTPKENQKTVDIFVELAGKRFYFEMKTANRVNLMSQVRRGISQLYEYAYRYEGARGDRSTQEIVLCLVLNMKPTRPAWLTDYLVADRKVNVCWRANGGFGFPGACAKALGPVLSPQG
jgi:hypothetical protein